MADTVFPVTDEVINKAKLRSWLSKAAWLADYVQSGYTVTDGGGLNATVASGVAHAGGVHLERDVSSTLALTANATNHIFLTVDENNTAGAVSFTVNTTGTAPGTPNVKIAEVVTGASSITSITDKRPLALFNDHVTLKNAKLLRALKSDGLTVRGLIGLASAGHVEVGDASETLKLLVSGANALLVRIGGNDYKVWHENNDGTGTGLDADTVDGSHASAFATSGHNHDSAYVRPASGDTKKLAGGLSGTTDSNGRVTVSTGLASINGAAGNRESSAGSASPYFTNIESVSGGDIVFRVVNTNGNGISGETVRWVAYGA